MAWNDEPPASQYTDTNESAHSKGFISLNADGSSGIYYMHSIPKYPFIHKDTGLIDHLSPASSQYGQSVLCHTLNSSTQASDLISQIKASNPLIYYNNFEDFQNTQVLSTQSVASLDAKNGKKLKSLLSIFQNLSKEFNLKKLSVNQRKSMGTQKGNEQLIKKDEFAKTLSKVESNKLGDEPLSQKLGEFTFVTKPASMLVNVFESFLAPFWSNALKTNVGFYIETWGRPLIPSDCDSKNQMINVQSVKNGSMIWTETQDHSKWAISVQNNLKLVCVGDLNHQTSQAQRGGSFLCLTNDLVYKAFSSLILSHDCDSIQNKSDNVTAALDKY